jgi:hypothetical protein
MSLREINKAILHKYSQSTLSKFDIIGSYFVNLYYNEFYLKAKNLKNQGTYNNITEAYNNLLSSYVEFSKQQDFFKQIVKGIHTYCISTTRYTTMSHKECIDFMVSEFVPINLWSSLRENQKNKLFHDSLIHCIEEFTEKIIMNHLYIIIDNHDKDENIIILQDLFLTIILLEKDKIFSKFINPNKNSLDVFKNKLQQILTDKKQIEDDNNNLQKKIKILEDLNKKNSNIIIELQKNNKLLVTDIVKKQNEIKQLSEKEKILNDKLLQYIKAFQIQKSSIIKQNDNLMVNVKELNNKKTIKKAIPIKQKVVKEKNIQKKIVSNTEFDQYLDNMNSDDFQDNNECNKYLENKDSTTKESERELVDEESEHKSVDEESEGKLDVEESEHELVDDNESDNGKSVDEEFESYWNSNNSPIVRDLVFEKTNDNDYY